MLTWNTVVFVETEKLSLLTEAKSKASNQQKSSKAAPALLIKLQEKYYFQREYLQYCVKMNRSPEQQEVATKKGEGLARLAAIADVVARQRSPVAVPGPDRSENAAPSMQKRSLDREDHDSSAPLKKKMRAEENDDDEGSEKVIQFRQYQAEIWSEKFEDLIEFRKIYGHCHVPHYYNENAPLAQWVKRQRYQYKLKVDGKRSTLSDERIRLLNKIGFIWNRYVASRSRPLSLLRHLTINFLSHSPNSSHDAVWEERWNELAMYKRLHGDCIVPSNYEKNPQLAVWVKRQRRQYKFYNENKPTSMTKERIARLERLGFAWDCRKKDLGVADKSLEEETQIAPAASSTVNLFTQNVGIPPALPGVLPKCEFMTFSRKFSYIRK